MSIFDESAGTINLGTSIPELKAYSDSPQDRPSMDKVSDRVSREDINK